MEQTKHLILVHFYGLYGGLDLIGLHNRALGEFMVRVVRVWVRKNWKFLYQRCSICFQEKLWWVKFDF